MNKPSTRLSLFFALVLSLSLLLTACDLFPGSSNGQEQPEGVQLPDMVEEPGAAELSKDEHGLSKVDAQYLEYSKDKSERLLSSIRGFGERIDSYLNKIFDEAIYIKDNADYTASRDALLQACKDVERLSFKDMPAFLKNQYEQLVVLANRSRFMIYQIMQSNGTKLPDVYNELKRLADSYQQQADQFFNTVNSQGPEAASQLIAPLDWAAEEARKVELFGTFNVHDLGLKWGASRHEVMGVEGLLSGAEDKEYLAYETKVYLYTGTRSYHFNEHGQLDGYDYALNTASYDKTPGNNNVYEDLQAISPVLMYAFVLNTPAVPVTPTDQGGGIYAVSFDQAAETVLMTGDVNDPAKPVRIEVRAKRAK